jgi:hypothetical protein
MNKQEISLFNDHRFETNIKKFKLKTIVEDDRLIKSKDRVQHHGEVFTPKWMVQKMLSEPAIQEKLRDVHATFLEPSAGEGAFLKEILHQKLNYIDKISNKTNWRSDALWALMSIYGIELLTDNLVKAHTAMLEVFLNHYQAVMQQPLSIKTDLYKSVKCVIKTNIVQGNTLEYVNNHGQLIELSQWLSINGKVQRKTFSYKSLFNNSDINDTNAITGQLSLFDNNQNSEKLNQYKVCTVTKVYKEEKINV